MFCIYYIVIYFLGSISEGAFTSQQSLEKINLHGNLLTSLDGGAFRGLSNLRELNIGHNKLKKLNSDVFLGKNAYEQFFIIQVHFTYGLFC